MFPQGDLGLLASAAAAALFVGLSKGGLPAISSLSVPLLALSISPLAAAALLLPIYIASDLVGLWLYRHAYSARNLVILMPSAIAGIAVGWFTSSMVSDRAVTLLIGLMGLAFCVSNWWRSRSSPPPRPADVPRGIVYGAISGFTSFVAHAGGPPYQIYVLPQRLEKLVFAGTSTILFAVINWAKLVPYWQLGQFSPDNLRVAAWLIPVSIVGAVLGAKLTRIMPDKLFFRLVEITLLAVSLRLVYQAAFPAA